MFSLLLPYEDGRRRRTRAAHSHHYTVGIVSEKNKVLMQFLLTYGDRKLARAFVSRFPIRRSTRPPPTMGGRACRAAGAPVPPRCPPAWPRGFCSTAGRSSVLLSRGPQLCRRRDSLMHWCTCAYCTCSEDALALSLAHRDSFTHLPH